MPMKHRDYKREHELKVKRGESGVGSDSSDAKRHRARRAYEKKHGDLPESVHVDHKKPIKKGGSNDLKNLTTKSARTNSSQGGKLGNKKQKGIRKP